MNVVNVFTPPATFVKYCVQPGGALWADAQLIWLIYIIEKLSSLLNILLQSISILMCFFVKKLLQTSVCVGIVGICLPSLSSFYAHLLRVCHSLDHLVMIEE